MCPKVFSECAASVVGIIIKQVSHIGRHNDDIASYIYANKEYLPETLMYIALHFHPKPSASHINAASRE